MRMKAVRRFQKGFNLIEVLVAMAILGSVLLSIVTLFFLGRTNIYSGKQLTRATAATSHANEDLQAMVAPEVFAAFGPIGTTSTSSGATGVTVAGINYKDSFVYDTTQAGSAADVKGYLGRWAALLPKSNILKGKMTLIIMPQKLATAGDPTSAQVLQLRLVTEWQEGTRFRNVVLDTSMLQQPMTQ